MSKTVTESGHGKLSKAFHPKVNRASWPRPAKCVTCTPHLDERSGGNLHPLTDRYFTARELLRIQGLRDSFQVRGSLSDVDMQICNLVPGGLGLALAKLFRACVADTAAPDSDNPVTL